MLSRTDLILLHYSDGVAPQTTVMLYYGPKQLRRRDRHQRAVVRQPDAGVGVSRSDSALRDVTTLLATRKLGLSVYWDVTT
jgi:hypothetical protein